MASTFMLALDLGAKCGFAVGSKGAIAAGSVDLGASTEFDASRRLLALLNNISAAAGPTCLFYCAPTARRAGGGRRTRNAPVVQVVQEWAALNGIECVPMQSGDVKKAFTGNGNASASAMLDEAERRGFYPAAAEEARAIAIFDLALTNTARLVEHDAALKFRVC